MNARSSESRYGCELIYFMFKPPPAEAAAIDRLRRSLGIYSRYPPDRLHSTLLPLGQCEELSALRAAAGSIRGEPFPAIFDRLDGNMLVGRKKLSGASAFQRRLAGAVAAAGLAPIRYDFRMHVSLDYGARPRRRQRIEPIGWLVEEFLLIRSVHGRGHVELGRWPLIRRQLELPFLAPPLGVMPRSANFIARAAPSR